MKNFFVKAKLRSNKISNTGFIRITDEGIEGIFTFDYVRILLDGKKISLTLNELDLKFIPTTRETCIKQKIYQALWQEKTLESPLEYLLYDAEGNLLRLNLEDPIDDPIQVSRMLKNLEKFKV